MLSPSADILYKTTDFYAPEHERTWSGMVRDVAIDWPLGSGPPILSVKDMVGTPLAAADLFPVEEPCRRRYLVTGGAGFIGSNFIRHLLLHNPDAEVTNLDLSPTPASRRRSTS